MSSRAKNALRFAGGIAVSGVCLWYVLKGFEWPAIRSAFDSATWAWLIPAVLIYIVSFSLRTLRWRAILTPIATLPFFQVFSVLGFGYLVNNTLPARAGEFAKAYALSKRSSVTASTALGTIVVDRMTDLVGLLAVMLVALQVLGPDGMPLGRITGIILIGGAVGCGFLWGTARLARMNVDGANPLTIRVVDFLKRFGSGFLALQKPKRLVAVTVLSIAIWMIEVTGAMVIARAFSLSIGYVQAAALLVGIAVGVMIPAAPGYIGTYELFATKTLVFLGFPHAASLSFVLVLHFIQLLLSSAIGVPFLLRWKWFPGTGDLERVSRSA